MKPANPIRPAALAALAVLVLAGCRIDAPQRDLSKAAIGSNVIEFHYPGLASDQFADLAQELLEAAGADLQEGSIPPVSGSSGDSSFETDPAKLLMRLGTIELVFTDQGLEASLAVDVSDPVLGLTIFASGQPGLDCQVNVSVPAQLVRALLVAGRDGDGRPLVFVEGQPWLEGQPAVIATDPYCPVHADPAVATAVSGAVTEGLQQASELLADALAATLANMLGLDSAAAGSVAGSILPNADQGRLHFGFWPAAAADIFSAAGSRVGLAGGFESSRAGCVPAAAVDLPGTTLAAAEFGEVVPGTGESYQCALSISDDFLQQATSAAWRGGLFCRRAADGELESLDVSDLFPSLTAWGAASAIRVALWPGGQAQIAFSPADPDAGEKLPRLSVSLPRLAVDLYQDIDGSDMRVLGLTADVNLELAPRIEGSKLYLDLIETRVDELSIDYSEMLAEEAGSLRASAGEAITRIAGQLLEQLGPIEVPMVPGAAQLLGFKRLDGRTLLYFGP